MSDLTEFLLARIAEDEAAARSATGGAWTHEGAPNGFAPMVIANGGVVAETYDKPHLSDAAHIARHDPARVLAECEAKRRIMETYSLSAEERGIAVDAWILLRDAIAHLALPYDTHPDYDEAWRP